MDCPTGYNSQVEQWRNQEYPMLRDVIYLDHAGTALPTKSLMERFAKEMTNHLWCNPHSTSTAAQATSKRIERIRLRLLGHFHADPEEFDLIFVANATAGIKLVAEAFRDLDEFWFGYHAASHTSVVGTRELATSNRCFASDGEVETWLISASSKPEQARLFAYPAQSNMNGKRLPMDWCHRVRALGGETFSLLDAAALASTSSLDLSNASYAPDFTVVSLYKAFGFPDLGALIVRKASAHVWTHRRYFGGGTVDMVVCGESWHARKGTLHEMLEDGSLPIHNILALEPAISTHQDLFGSLHDVAAHCAALSQRLYDGLVSLRHWNNMPVCNLYHEEGDFGDLSKQGPIIAFNLYNDIGDCIGTTEVEKLASIRNIQLRTGGLCNPGGVAMALQLSPAEVKKNYAAGQRCGNDFDIVSGRPTGMIRVSLGPENILADVDKFLDFVREFFVQAQPIHDIQCIDDSQGSYFIESLTIYPIKSCCGWKIPFGKAWEVRQEGLAWDREWCVIRSGDGGVMSQKRYPKMALIRPTVDVQEGLLRVEFADKHANIPPIAIPLSLQPPSSLTDEMTLRNAQICGDDINAHAYTLPDVTRFFTEALGVPCQLGRFPPNGTLGSARHAKPHLQLTRNSTHDRSNGSNLRQDESEKRPILLSNESPILIVSRSSINRLNEQIKANNGKAVGAEAFRPNIVIMEARHGQSGPERPYAEDEWRMIRMGREIFELLGKCRRCQMVCIDQDTGKRNQEPFVTLAKTRRLDGKVYFGQHACHVWRNRTGQPGKAPTIAVGDAVEPVSVMS